MYLTLTFVLTICIIISVFQLCLYYYINFPSFSNFKRNKPYINNLLILFIVLTFYNFILPKFFYPKPKPGFTYCGPSAIDFHLIFLKFGLISSLTTHFTWRIITKYFLNRLV